jgi:hypothetical protein
MATAISREGSEYDASFPSFSIKTDLIREKSANPCREICVQMILELILYASLENVLSCATRCAGEIG